MMTVSRKAFEMVDQAAAQRAWIRPSVQKLSAGCAENGTPSGVPDVGVTFS